MANMISDRTELGIWAGAMALTSVGGIYTAVTALPSKKDSRSSKILSIIDAVGLLVTACATGALALWCGKALWLGRAVAQSTQLRCLAVSLAGLAVSIAADWANPNPRVKKARGGV